MRGTIILILCAVCSFGRGVVLSGRTDASAPFVAGAKALYDPASLAALTDGTGVGEWQDSSANGNHAVQSAPALQPLKATVTNNGTAFSVIRFDGSSSYALTASGLFNSGYNKTFTYVLGEIPSDGTRRVSASNGTLWSAFQDTSLWTTATNLSIPNSHVGFLFGLNVMTIRYDGTNKTIRVNGYPSVVDAATGNLGLTGDLTIGQGNTGAEFKGDIAYMAIFNRALTDNEALSVEKQVATKMGVSKKPQVIFEGNSLTAGFGVTGSLSYPAQCMAALGSGYDSINYGRNAQPTSQMATLNSSFYAYSGFRTTNIVAVWEITNELYFGTNAAAAYSNYTNFCGGKLKQGYKVIALTVLPRSDSGTPGTFEADRQTINTNMRSQWPTFATALVDVAGDNRIGDSGDETDLTYYQNDLVHLNATGYGIVAIAVKNSVLGL